jgi:hypothetical protein
MNMQRLSVHGFGFALAALLAGMSGACMSVEAEAPEIEITQADVRFTGVPFGNDLGSQKKSFTGSHPALDLPSELTAEVRAVQVTLKAKSGITDFSFLSRLRVTMQDDAKKKEPVDLLHYERDPAATAGAVLSIPAQNPNNLIDQWKSDAAVFGLELEGTLPEQDWTVDVTLSFSGKATWTY